MNIRKRMGEENCSSERSWTRAIAPSRCLVSEAESWMPRVSFSKRSRRSTYHTKLASTQNSNSNTKTKTSFLQRKEKLREGERSTHSS